MGRSTVRAAMALIATVSLIALPGVCAQADSHFGPLSGKPRAVDGDTLEFGFKRVDLYGADSLERFQKCVIGGQSTACGADAWEAIVNLITKTPIQCEMKAINRYKRNMAICRNANGVDIGLQLISMGWAVARDDNMPAYTAAQQAAKAARKGAWAGKFIDPLKWRRGERLPEHAISIY
ncbi:nuclease [Thalassospira mesophila]|uniref:Nuclease n=2 Tax=Thalassospira mesophila TaxID=1293891 RepID=A0A1Y2L0F9_9PROT|nr:nuclease [Thalassospira mesophila]